MRNDHTEGTMAISTRAHPAAADSVELAVLVRLAESAADRPLEDEAWAVGVWPEGDWGGDELPLLFALAAAEAFGWRALVVYDDERDAEVEALRERVRGLNPRVETRLQTRGRRELGNFGDDARTAPAGASVTLASFTGMSWAFASSLVPADAFHLVVTAPGARTPGDSHSWAAGHFHHARLVAVWSGGLPRSLGVDAPAAGAITIFDAGLLPRVTAVASRNAFLDGGAEGFLDAYREARRGLVYDLSLAV